MTKGWWLPVVLACVAHAAVTVLPVQLGAPQKKAEPDLTFQFSPPPPPPQPLQTPPPQKFNKPIKRRKRRIIPEPPPPPVQEMDEEPVDEAPEVEESPQELPPAPERVKEVVEAPKPKFDLRAYGQRIHQLVLKHRRYPRSARRLGLEGKVFVKIAVGRNGELAREPEIYRSSGEAVLDKEALRMVRAATPLLPLPNEFEKESASLVIPVQFHLRD